MAKTYQIDSDGTTVWVNDNTGYCIGRFGRMGIEIHANPESGNECLFCTHKQVDQDDWVLFAEKMFEFYQVVDLESHCPKRFVVESHLHTPK